MVEKHASRTEQFPCRFEVCGYERLADGLGHTDGDDLVIYLRLFQFAVIINIDTAALLQSRLLDSLTRQFCLLPTEGDAVSLYAVGLGCIDEQPAPTTTDIQQTLPGL